jgi:threonine 3-dehydrogenase
MNPVADRTMTAVVKARPAVGYDIADVPVPQVGPADVLVRIDAAAVCGTDILLYKWDPLVRSLIRGMPFIPGHECCGVVDEVGPEVTAVSPGDRVCAETHIPCGKCYQCLHGSPHICRNLVLFGHHVDGCFAEYALLPDSAVYRLTTDLAPEVACLLEPFGVSLRAVQAADPEGDSLFVNGCGSIGLFAIAAARRFGAGQIIAAEPNPLRRELARRMGADVVLDPAEGPVPAAVCDCTAGDGAGCVIEASGAPGAVADCLKSLRKGGRVVVVGNPKAPVEITDVMPDLMHKELTLQTLHGRRMYQTWEMSEAMLAAGDIDVGAVAAHTFAMSDVEAAMQALLAGEACKARLVPR